MYNFFKDIFYFLVRDLYLSIGLGMIRCCHPMFYIVLLFMKCNPSSLINVFGTQNQSEQVPFRNLSMVLLSFDEQAIASTHLETQSTSTRILIFHEMEEMAAIIFLTDTSCPLTLITTFAKFYSISKSCCPIKTNIGIPQQLFFFP